MLETFITLGFERAKGCEYYEMQKAKWQKLDDFCYLLNLTRAVSEQLIKFLFVNFRSTEKHIWKGSGTKNSMRLEFDEARDQKV